MASHNIERLLEGGSNFRGTGTGLLELDAMLCGLQPSELIVVAARPGEGKTAFMLNTCTETAMKVGGMRQTPVGIFSLEMGASALLSRIVYSTAMVDSHKLRSGFADAGDWKKVIGAIDRLNQAPIFIDDTPAIEIHKLCSRARNLKREKNIGLLAIDYIQLVSAPGENRNLQVGCIARSLKSLAKELEIPVLALSQLSRSGDRGRRTRVPDLESLRDSGEIEAHADTVLFIHKPTKDQENGAIGEDVQLVIGKQRNGPRGTVRAVFLKEYVKFVNLSNYKGEPT